MCFTAEIANASVNSQYALVHYIFILLIDLKNGISNKNTIFKIYDAQIFGLPAFEQKNQS